ncbi:MAG TPA: hypothetical protein VMB80_18265 [Candidatus Acidoferrum sp.]|nr:hypothetical protein [Candidatus Acidoferrum sp.]
MKPDLYRALFPIRLVPILAACFILPRGAPAQSTPSGPPVDPAALKWPRYEATNGFEFAIYQPQLSSWTGNQLQGRAVVAVRPAGTANESYGVVYFTARTDVDKINRLVTLQDIQLTQANFPTQPDQQSTYLAALQALHQNTLRTIPLDHLEAVYAVSADNRMVKGQPVKNDPPRIIYTTRPSLLVLVDGPPVLKPLTGAYDRVVNSRAILLQNTNALEEPYFLYAASNWYAAPSLEGPWAMTGSPPPDIGAALSAALATGQVDPLNPQDPAAAATPLHIYVSLTPAELIETKGTGELVPVPGTDLLYVNNTASALFWDRGDSCYYVLISGRWFKAASVYGPWAFVPPGSLPADFQNIPPDSAKANVLCSVPGTPQAREAVIANSIPQTATIQRDQAKLTVDYSGAPDFVPIAGTPLSYAVNTATPVIEVDAQTYYACAAGVWFTAAAPGGPWTVATSVPPVIYTIPPSCPLHYVTYVYTYGSTTNAVYAGYTPGYDGTVVSDGNTVVYGTGYSYPLETYGATWYPYPATYGYGAAMALNGGTGYAYGFTAGMSSGCAVAPYWGSYHYAPPAGCGYSRVNINATSCYPHWGTAARSSTAAYNPYTGNAAVASRAAAYNPYSGLYGANSKGAAGNVYTGQAAGYDRGVVGNVNTGNKAAWNNNWMYADPNGNIYRYSPSSGAQQYNNGGWNSANQPAATARFPTAQSVQSGTSGAFPTAQAHNPNQPAPQPATAQPDWVNRENQAQAMGQQRFDNYAGDGGGWGGFRGGGRRR